MRRLSIVLAVASALVAAGPLQARAQGSADLQLTLSASTPSLIANESVTFTLQVRNTGPDSAERTNVFDHVPPDVIVAAVSEGGAYQPANDLVAWQEGTVPAATTITEWVTFTVIHPENPLTDEARAHTRSADPTTPNTVAADTQVEPEPGVEYVSVRDTGLTPPFHNVPLGNTVQWDNFGSSSHEITDAHALGLLDTGLMAPLSYARYTFDVSGEIRTQDLPEFPINTGKLVIPVEVSPTSGSTGTTYTVSWALSVPPNGLVEDIQIKRPGGVWQRWFSNQTATLQHDFVPDAGVGNYAFRSRLRDPVTDVHSRFGPPVTIAVS